MRYATSVGKSSHLVKAKREQVWHLSHHGRAVCNGMVLGVEQAEPGPGRVCGSCQRRARHVGLVDGALVMFTLVFTAGACVWWGVALAVMAR